VSLLMFPLAIAYAILKDNLFDVDAFIRLSVSYVLVSGFAVIFFFALTALFSLGLQDITGQSSQIAAVLSTLLMVLTFRPLRIRLDGFLDRRFFREKYEYQHTIRRASKVLAGIVELMPLLEQILDTVIESVKIERGCILLRDENRGQFDVMVHKRYPGSAVFPSIDTDHPLMRYLESSERALQINQVEASRELRMEREAVWELMRKLNVILVIPIIYERRAIGVFCLGEKKSKAWYSSEDIELVQTLMIQTAVSIENARKVEELKKMVELETSYRELKQIDRMKDNFLHMVSHDLRTPMTGIMGYAEIMRDKYEKLKPETGKSYLEIIMKEGERLTRLINDLLDLQRFEAGKMVLDFEDADLCDIVKQSLDSFTAAANKKNITIERNLLDSPIIIHAHSDRLMQVMTNLLSNAVKFTAEGGKVSVDVEKVAEDGVSLVKVSVSDTGPGIPEDLQPRIFSKFQQAQSETRSENQGSGLGLALSLEIIEHHGGKIGVQSETNKGSTFYFILKTKD
jgi:signal transduction histidine kinase